jgi:oxygen-independent coproporphyrinogen-3 oxidase
MSALQIQLKYELKRFKVQKQEIETIFIGGGTPSTINSKLYKSIFEIIYPFLKKDAEITTEANPNSATISWLKGMLDLGVNRVSFGVQSFQKEKLKSLNRSHSPQQAIKAIQNAKKIGFEHISLDLIYNYRGDTKELLKYDIDQAFQLPIDHISAYELTIESGTKFSNTPQVKQEDDNLAFFVADEITKRGFNHYEISNFGKYESIHNKGYWRLRDYIGVGAGAVGFKKDTRYYPTIDIDRYIQNPLLIKEESISSQELLTEKIFLGLRSNIGVEEKILDIDMKNRANFLVERGKLRKSEGIYRNSNFFLSDEVALYILG